jgi:hypothetical protein
MTSAPDSAALHINIYPTGRDPKPGAKLIRGFARQHREHGSTP